MYAEEVVDALLALEEPWRSRFLHAVARMAVGGQDGRGEPTREELEEWLEDLELRLRVARMLRDWTGGQEGGRDDEGGGDRRRESGHGRAERAGGGPLPGLRRAGGAPPS